MYQCRGCGASKKGEVLEPLPKGNDMEIRAGPEKKPDLKKFMKKM